MSIAQSPTTIPQGAINAYDYLVGQGLTPAQASGVVGNLMQESGTNPNSVGDNGTSFGIAQWHLGRRDALYSYAQSIGQPANSLTAQLGFLWSELTGSYMGALSAVKATNSPAAAAMAFQNTYERCSTCNSGARIANANQVYSVMTGQNPPAGSTDAALAASSVSSSQSGGSTDCKNDGNCCAVGWTWPSALGVGGGDVCLWHNSWTRATLGGLLIVAGAVVGIAAFTMLTKTSIPVPGVGGMVGKIRNIATSGPMGGRVGIL